MGRLAKLTDLFEEGAVVPLTTPSGTKMVVWISKLSPFEVEQSNHEGRIARARTMLAIREVGTPDYALFQASSMASKPDSIITSLIDTKANEHVVQVIRDMHSDPEWKERLETLEWSQDQIEDKPEDDPEVVALSRILDEYQGEMTSRTDHLRNELRMELTALPPEALREQYADAYIEAQGMRAFTREQQASQVYYCLRQCEATAQDDGTYTHENCDHGKKWMTDRKEVDSLPLSLLNQIREAYENLNMPQDVARFSGGPASSSASYGPSSKQEGSTASGPAETSDAQGGTS